MVQTKEQYVLVHQAVRELFKEQLCMIDSHPYENVDPNGLLVIKDEENTYDCIEYVSTCSSEGRYSHIYLYLLCKNIINSEVILK